MSFLMRIDPRRQAAAVFISGVRDELMRALLIARRRDGATQSSIAEKLDVHRSVINRELSGQSNLTLRRVAELAWAVGFRPDFRLVDERDEDGCNFVTTTSVGQNILFIGKTGETGSDANVLPPVHLNLVGDDYSAKP